MTQRVTWRTAALAGVLLGSLTASCKPDDLVGEGELPTGVGDPKDTQTPAGALRAYRAGLIAYRSAYGGPYSSLIVGTGLMTDELTALDYFFPPDDFFDRRIVPEFSDIRSEQNLTYGYANYITIYKNLQAARAKTRVAAWLIRNFGGDTSQVLAAQLDATEAYATLHLAENYCSGVPLSTVDPDGYTLESGSTTEEALERAIVLFDNAIATSGDSARFVDFARIGKARALMGLNRYAEAAQLAALIPDGFEYRLRYDSTITGTNGDQAHDAANFMYQLSNEFTSGPGMADNEGINGIDWMSGGDPRSEAATYSNDYSGNPRYVPRRYSPTGDSPLVVGGWIEARLIQAEADLAAGGSAWLDQLNALRAAATFPPPANDPGGDPQTLAPLTDPGDADARVDLLFKERAMWLHLSGQRLSDMRRLVRQYGRDPNDVFPRGLYHKGGTYGSEVTWPMPAEERTYNPLFTGCITRGSVIMRTNLRGSVILLALLLGCGSDDPVDATGNGQQIYWSLGLNHQAVTLGLASDLDTLKLVATPRAPDGAVIDGLGMATFTTTNSDVVSIDDDGLLTANAATAGVMIVASLTAQGVTHTDTAMVMVTEDPGVNRLGTFSIQPIDGDSAKFALGGTYTEPYRNLTPTLLDTDGNPLEGAPVYYRSLDPTVGLIDPFAATVTGIRPGYFTIVATATVYGQEFTDSLRYRIGYPGVVRPRMFGKMYAYVTYEVGTILPSVMKVGTGAVMELEYSMGGDGYLADIVFEDPSMAEAVPEQYSCVNYELACDEAGNIEPYGPPAPLVDYTDYDKFRLRARRLTQPGTYHLSSAAWTSSATIIVVDESEP